MAVRHPNEVERVILSGPALTLDEAERARARTTLAAQSEPVPDAAGTHLQPIWREGLSSAFGNLRIPPTELELLTEFFLEQMKAGPRRGEAHIAAFRYAIERRLALLQRPALILSATEDMAACRRNTDLLRLLPPDLPIMIREFNTAGEYPRLMPAEFALVIREFLRMPPAALETVGYHSKRRN
jgi:pimeloyl-ACP methyl ester carboxylesterase